MNITVFLGANPGKKEVYLQRAKEFGAWIGEHGHTLVYGGSNTGLMGALADSCIDANGKVIGVELKMFEDEGFGADNLTEKLIFENMADRKKCMLDKADVVVIFPGGMGTLEELGEAASSANLGFRDYNIILYNIEGFYDDFMVYVKKTIEAGFVREEFLDRFLVAKDITELECAINKE